MKRLSFLFVAAVLALMPMRADSYREALAAYMNLSASSTQQSFAKSLPALMETLYNGDKAKAEEAYQAYTATQLSEDLVDIFMPVYREHVSEDELNQLVQLYSEPRYAELKAKAETLTADIENAPEYQAFASQLEAAMMKIMAGEKPKNIETPKTVTKDYAKAFRSYYKASGIDEVVTQTFSAMAPMLTSTFQSYGIPNAEKIVDNIMGYVNENMEIVMLGLFNRTFTKDDLKVLEEPTSQPAYQHAMAATKDLLKDPMALAQQLIGKMSTWVDNRQAAPAVEEEEEDETLFVTVEQMPEFPGGQQGLFRFLSENVRYPQIAKENGIQGRCILQFIVEKDGSIADVQVVRSAGDPSLDKEAMRVIKAMPRWKPGVQRGKPVRVRYTIPVNFKLPDPEPKPAK